MQVVIIINKGSKVVFINPLNPKSNSKLIDYWVEAEANKIATALGFKRKNHIPESQLQKVTFSVTPLIDHERLRTRSNVRLGVIRQLNIPEVVIDQKMLLKREKDKVYKKNVMNNVNLKRNVQL
jgi:hypothetical protein